MDNRECRRRATKIRAAGRLLEGGRSLPLSPLGDRVVSILENRLFRGSLVATFSVALTGQQIVVPNLNGSAAVKEAFPFMHLTPLRRLKPPQFGRVPSEAPHEPARSLKIGHASTIHAVLTRHVLVPEQDKVFIEHSIIGNGSPICWPSSRKRHSRWALVAE